jgi:hypothetical protein
MLKGHGPSTFFITLSCAENWWPDLQCLLHQLELIGGNHIKAQAIKHGCRKAMSNAARKFPLYVKEFFMKLANLFMKTVMKKALQIEHYWGRVEFAPGRGAIHLHIVAIAKNKAYLQELYNVSLLRSTQQLCN